MTTRPQKSEAFHRSQISGFILAGGRSSRLGQDKVLLPWNGRTLLQHAIERLRQVCGTVRVCADRVDLRAAGLVAEDACIRDAVSGAGPLGGIVAALEQSPSEWNFFLAVDLPLVPVAFLRALAEHAESRRAGDPGLLCVLPTIAARPQPLCGVYRRRLAPALRRALMEGKYKVMLALRDALAETDSHPPSSRPSRPASPAMIDSEPAGPGLQFFSAEKFAASSPARSALQASDWFLNVNTQEEWQRARLTVA